MAKTQWFAVRKELSHRQRLILTILSFVIPLLIWSLVSYAPFIWHPKMEITDPGGVSYFRTGMLIDREVFDKEVNTQRQAGDPEPQGKPANPIYLPAPHEVATAFYTAFTPEPKRRSE